MTASALRALLLGACLLPSLTVAAAPVMLHRPQATLYQRIDREVAPLDPSFQRGLAVSTKDGKFGLRSRVDLRKTATTLTVKHWLWLDYHPSISKADRATFERRLLEANTFLLDDQMSVLDRSTGQKLRLRTELGFLREPPKGVGALRRYRVEVSPAHGIGANAVRLPLDAAHSSLAHELSHRLFLAYDEYKPVGGASPEIVRRVQGQPLPGLMGDSAHPYTQLMPLNAMGIARAARKTFGGDFVVVRNQAE